MHQTNSKLGHSAQFLTSTFKNCLVREKEMIEKLSWFRGHQKVKTLNTVGMLEQKKDINGKTGIWI